MLAAKIALVRAVEEGDPAHISPHVMLEARAVAGDPSDPVGWVGRRASYLVDHGIGSYAALLTRFPASLSGSFYVIGGAFVLGLGSNFLGTTARIHVLWNPIVLLVAWNLALYAGLALEGIFSLRRRPNSASTTRRASSESTGAWHAVVVIHQRIARRLRKWFHAGTLADSIEAGRRAAEVNHRFIEYLQPVMARAVQLFIRRTLHFAAIALTAGAVVGMYVRGLFFEYQVAWESTFITEPAAVAAVLRILLAPAAAVLGSPALQDSNVAALLAGGSQHAAPWIHLYAVSAMILIIIPRLLLALASSSQLRRAMREASVDLRDEYYRDLLRRARDFSPEKLESEIRQGVRAECEQFAKRFSRFVCEELYDGKIAPRLRRFREEGGALQDLEEELKAECERFEPILQMELSNARLDLQRDLASRVQRLLAAGGSHIAHAPDASSLAPISGASLGVATGVSERVNSDLLVLVTGVVSTSVGVVVGTLTGGFGKALGVALLAGVVHSGPIAWLIGAMGGLIASGAAFWLGKEKLLPGAKTLHLPAAVLKTAIWSGRYERLIEDGRRRRDECVQQSFTTQVDQMANAIGDHLWHGLMPAVGEMQRPRA